MPNFSLDFQHPSGGTECVSGISSDGDHFPEKGKGGSPKPHGPLIYTFRIWSDDANQQMVVKFTNNPNYYGVPYEIKSGLVVELNKLTVNFTFNPQDAEKVQANHATDSHGNPYPGHNRVPEPPSTTPYYDEEFILADDEPRLVTCCWSLILGSWYCIAH